MASVGGVYLNFGLWAVSLIPAWIVVSKFGASEAQGEMENKDDKSLQVNSWAVVKLKTASRTAHLMWKQCTVNKANPTMFTSWCHHTNNLPITLTKRLCALELYKKHYEPSSLECQFEAGFIPFNQFLNHQYWTPHAHASNNVIECHKMDFIRQGDNVGASYPAKGDRLNGHKNWIAFGGRAGIAVIFAMIIFAITTFVSWMLKMVMLGCSWGKVCLSSARQ